MIQKHIKAKKDTLTLDIDNLDNPKLTHTHYPKTSSYLPPQNPTGTQNFPNSTKNSRGKRNSRKNEEENPVCLLSMNRGKRDSEEHQRTKTKKSSKGDSMKRKSKAEYENYGVYGESYVELEDGTRNYQIREYQKIDSGEKGSKRKSKSKKKKRQHKKGSSSYGGFGHLYETYGDKGYNKRERDRDLEKKYKKMKLIASREASKNKDSLLNFGGAQWK